MCVVAKGVLDTHKLSLAKSHCTSMHDLLFTQWLSTINGTYIHIDWANVQPGLSLDVPLLIAY